MRGGGGVSQSGWAHELGIALTLKMVHVGPCESVGGWNDGRYRRRNVSHKYSYMAIYGQL